MLFKLLFFVSICNVIATHVHVSEIGQEKVVFDLNEAKELFDEFIEYFDKHYDNKTEYELRLRIFTKNLEDVNNRNKGATSEIYGITQFLDMTTEEFIRDYTGLKLDTDLNKVSKDDVEFQQMKLSQREVPEHWDWRQEGVVTPVKNQGYCSSCWSFGAVGCVEAQYAIKYKKLITLSEQQLVDCFPEGGGCRTGSFPHLGLNSAAKLGGFMTQSDYPYRGAQGLCRFNRRKVAVKVRAGRQHKHIRSEEQLKRLVFEHGPVSVGIAALQGFYEYKGGIASAERLGCKSRPGANHAVLIVGYGTENGIPYWIIKNSFGRKWGEQGYMRLVRGRNACSILEYVATADVV